MLGVDDLRRRSGRCRRTRACSPRRSGSSRCCTKRKPQVRVTVSPVSVRSASTVQRASALDHSALTTRWRKRIVAVDAALAGGVADVAQDRGAVGDRLRLGPRPEAVAERVHVGVGADPGVAEEVPGAADPLARLEDRVALAGTALLQVMGGADAREPGADDQHVDMLKRHGVRLPGQVGRLQHAEGYPRRLQPCEQGVTHCLRGGDLAGARRQLVEGEAEGRLGQHLRGLAVAGVAAGDLGDDTLAAALADEPDLEPALGALGLVRPLARGFDLQQQLAGRRQLRQRGNRPHPDRQRATGSRAAWRPGDGRR